MAATKVPYDQTTVIGAEIATGVDLVRRGMDLIYRAKAAIDAATDGGTDKDALISGDFGATNSAAAALYWDATYTMKYTLDNAISGGLATALANMDKGISG